MPVTLDSNALVTLAVCKEMLNIPDADTGQDEVLKRLINSCTFRIERYIDRKVKKRSWTEYQDGRNNDRLLLRQWPAEKPSEVWIDADSKFTDTANKLATSDYELEIAANGEGVGIILMGGLYFPNGRRNVKIIYPGGYDPIPYDLEEACWQFVEFLYNVRNDQRIGVISKGKNNETTQYEQGIPKFLLPTLDLYRRNDFGAGYNPIGNT